IFNFSKRHSSLKWSFYRRMIKSFKNEIYPIINNLNKVELSLLLDLFLNQSIALRVSSGNVTCFYEHVDVLRLCLWTYYFQTKLLKFQLEKSLFQALESCGQRIRSEEHTSELQSCFDFVWWHLSAT